MKQEKRHTCIICKKKRYEPLMLNVFGQSWACGIEGFTNPACSDHGDIETMKEIQGLSVTLKILNVRALV